MREQQEEEFRFFKLDKYYKDRWDDYVYYKARAEKYFSIIRRNGGHIPSIKELTPAKKHELFSKAKEYFWCLSASMNKIKKKRMFRREFMAHHYERMMNISRFIVQAIPAFSDDRNNMNIGKLCGLFHSDLFSSDSFTSYADEKTSGARYLYELFERYGIEPRLDRIVIVLTTGEYHKELTGDEKKLCRLLVGDCKSSDILLATDPSLSRQVRINYATFNSEKPLVTI